MAEVMVGATLEVANQILMLHGIMAVRPMVITWVAPLKERECSMRGCLRVRV
jgi:hypothetical protein